MSTAEIDVAVAIIRDSQNQILVNQRQADKEHAGFWEFPGGKFALGENASEALKRECMEELGIEVLSDTALLELVHTYPNKRVRLHVRWVVNYRNIPSALESQKLAWLSLSQLYELNLLPADQPILKALEQYLIEGVND